MSGENVVLLLLALLFFIGLLAAIGDARKKGKK
jgi:hypothetical protein